MGLHLDLIGDGLVDAEIVDVQIGGDRYDCEPWSLDFDRAEVMSNDLEVLEGAAARLRRDDGWLRLAVPGATAPADCFADPDPSLTYDLRFIDVTSRALGRTTVTTLELPETIRFVFDELQLDVIRDHDPSRELGPDA